MDQVHEFKKNLKNKKISKFNDTEDVKAQK